MRILRWCRDNCSIQPTTAPLALAGGIADIGVIWPWDILSWLWDSPEHQSLLTWIHDPPEEAVQRVDEYWSKLSHLPFYADLALEDPSSTVPISWHVDGVKVYKTQKAWVYSFASSIRKGPSIDTKLLFLLFRDSQMVKPLTHDSVAMHIAYAMRVLETGRFPDKDHHGQPFPEGSREANRIGAHIAGGWRFAFSAFKADLEARVMVHKLVRNWASDSICEHCLASKLPSFGYGDFSNNAAYFECMFGHREFLLLNPANKQSSWIHVKGWHKDRNVEEACLHIVALGAVERRSFVERFAHTQQCFSLAVI